MNAPADFTYIATDVPVGWTLADYARAQAPRRPGLVARLFKRG